METKQNKEIERLEEVLKNESLDPKVRESVEKRLKHIENDTTIFK